MPMNQLAQALLNGIAIGSVYVIFALGYTLIFSILRVINFAHAAIFTLGAYFTYTLAGGMFGFNGVFANGQLPFSLPFWLAALVGAGLAGLVAVLIERVAFRPLRRQGADALTALVSSLGVAVVIVNLVQYFVGAELYSYPDSVYGALPPSYNFGTAGAPIPIRTAQVVICAVSLVLLILLYLLINHTKIGLALRAVAQDTTVASILGVNVDGVIMVTFFISGVLGAIAGTLVGLSVSIAGPYFGVAFGLKGLAVIVLGGLGSIPGTVLGGFIIGIAEALVPAQFIAFKEAVPFVLLFIVLLVRPQGLLGHETPTKV